MDVILARSEASQGGDSSPGDCRVLSVLAMTKGLNNV